MERRLAAILAADVVGYSRLIREDEASTLAALKAHREELIEPKLAQYHGRIVKLMGDGLLSEFPSAVEAVQCAVEIQHAMAERNADVPEERQTIYRIGINIGDIVVEDDDIFGDGVNIAARLEGLADPGGICISRPVHTQIKGKLDLTFEHLGDKEVKNIAEPVSVYRVALDTKVAALVTPVIEEVSKPARQRWPVVAAVVAVLVLTVSGAIWWQPWMPDVEPASVERMAFPLPNRPSIAVLPFENLSKDPEQDYFANGITENIITELARFPSLFVIAEYSTSAYQGRAVEVRQVSEELGVQYVLEGSVQRSQGQIRISARLIDATTGRHLWSERYDSDVNDIFAVQDQTTEQIVATLATEEGVLADAWQKRIARKGTQSLEAYDLELQATQIASGWTKDDFAQAKALYERAIDADPDYARPYANLAMTLVWEVYSKWAPDESLKRAVELAKESIARDDGEAWGHWALGAAYLKLGNFDEAIAEYERALALNPNDADVLAESAFALAWVGRPNDGVENVLAAIRLNPRHPDYYLWALGVAYYDAGKYKEAAATLTSRKSPNLKSNLYLAAAYAQLGRQSEAQRTIQKILEENPDSSIELWGDAQPYQQEAALNHYIDGLRKAGLPERSPLPLPDKPSIAVLPFTNMSGDPEQEYFADGMTEDLITDLSKISGLFIIARNSSFSYKGQQVNVRQVAEELGVRYVLEGSVRRAGEQVRINTQLIDATTGGHLWAERFDGSLADVFAFQDQVTKRVVDALALQLTPQETERVVGPSTENVEAHDAYLLGLSYYNQRTPEDNAIAKTHFERAIDLDPSYSAAYTALAKVYAQATVGGAAYGDKLGIAFFHGYTKAWELLELGMSQPNADYHVLRSWLALRKHQHDRAIAEAEQALKLNPNDVEALEALAEALIYAGRPKAGIELAERAIRQNPVSLGRALYLMGTAEFALGNSVKALEYLDRAVRQAPKEKSLTGLLMAIHGELGQVEKAKATFNDFEQQEHFQGTGHSRLHQVMSIYPFSDRDVLDRLANGFKAAGVPVGIGGYLPLHKMNKLSGPEIKSLLFGKEIKGIWFWYVNFTWRQQRTIDGAVEHFGYQIYPNVHGGDTGVGRVENDMLCEQWTDMPKDLEICMVVFRVPEPTARSRWGDYVMVTGTGPHPFRVAE